MRASIRAYTVTRTTYLLKGDAHFDFFWSQAARGFFCERMPRKQCSLDQTAQFLIFAWRPGKPWPKQVRTQHGKRPLTRTPNHPEASGETTSLYKSRSHPPRACEQGRFGHGNKFSSSSSQKPYCAGTVKHVASFGSTHQRLILTSPS